MAIKKFLEEMLNTKDKIMAIIYSYTPMLISDNEQKEYDMSNVCHDCKKKIEKALNIFKRKMIFNYTITGKTRQVFKKYNIKVRDHCHFTGKFLVAAHNNCNLNRNYDKFKIPVFFIMEKVIVHVL